MRYIGWCILIDCNSEHNLKKERKIKQDIAQKLDDAWSSAQDAIYRKDYVAASRILKSIIREDRANAAAYNRLAIINAKQGSLRKASRLFKRARKLEPSAAANHNLGLIYYELAAYTVAATYFKQALALEDTLAPRHIAMAKVQEKLGNRPEALKHLKAALKLEDSKKTRAIYVDALERFKKDQRLSSEMIEALKLNRIPWTFEALDEYEYAVDIAETLQKNLSKLVDSIRNKKLSPRSEQTRDLGIIFLHNSRASLELNHKNYSHAALNISRSMYEIYLKSSYAMRIKSYRGYAEIDRRTLADKLGANRRLLSQISPTDPKYQTIVQSSHNITMKIRSLDRRYPELANVPSFRGMAIALDGGTLGENYELFSSMYDKGSDSTHNEKSAVARIVGMSGTKHAGIFIDSHGLIIDLLKLMIAFGYMFTKLPEISSANKLAFTKFLDETQEKVATLSSTHFKS